MVSVQPASVVRPAWQRARFWIAIAAALVVGALAVVALTGQTQRPLDPSSPSKRGSKALAVVLVQHGARITRTDSLATAQHAGATVVVASPDSYDGEQLADLRARADRLVLVAPSAVTLSGASIAGSAPHSVAGPEPPGCDWPGAAAGTVDLPDGTIRYSGGMQSCYGGAVVFEDGLVVLGSADLLMNRHVGDQGVAALDVNAITDNGAALDITWLLPGTEATGTAAPTYWQLFPGGARRAFVWLLGLGVLLVLWQARRFGPVVSEPLPVVVRSAEVVEGHGRLYRRAGARDRAADALRSATTARLVARLGLPRRATLPEVVAAVTPATGREPAAVAQALGGPPPADDAGLLRLTADLDALEEAAGVPSATKGTPP